MTRRFTIHGVGAPVPMGRARWQALPEQPSGLPTLGMDECIFYRCTSCPHPAVVSIANTVRGMRVMRHPVEPIGNWAVASPEAAVVA